jgi:hypothetical protein
MPRLEDHAAPSTPVLRLHKCANCGWPNSHAHLCDCCFGLLESLNRRFFIEAHQEFEREIQDVRKRCGVGSEKTGE